MGEMCATPVGARRGRRKARHLVALIGLLAAWLGGADVARAVSVEVAFEGMIHRGDGTIPGGAVVEGASFTGTLSYDPERPVGPESWAYYIFEDGAAALSVSLAGVSYATDPIDPWVSIGISNNLLVDPHTGEPLPPGAAEAVVQDSFDARSANNILVDGMEYEISLGFFEISEDWPAGLFDSVALPSSSAWLAEQLVGAEVSVRGSGDDYFLLLGTVASATPVPEPSTAALLGVGIVLLAAIRRRA